MRPAGRGIGAMLTAMPIPGDCAVLAHFVTSVRSGSARSAEATPVGNLAALFALVFGRHLDGNPDCPAGAGLRDSRAGDRYLLRSDRLSPVTEDRPHFYVATLGAAYAAAPASWPS